jgi:hypothetical protein
VKNDLLEATFTQTRNRGMHLAASFAARHLVSHVLDRRDPTDSSSRTRPLIEFTNVKKVQLCLICELKANNNHIQRPSLGYHCRQRLTARNGSTRASASTGICYLLISTRKTSSRAQPNLNSWSLYNLFGLGAYRVQISLLLKFKADRYRSGLCAMLTYAAVCTRAR